MPSVRETLAETIRAVLTEKGTPRSELRDDDVLVAGLGLDSLELAVVVVRLEGRLGRDPFRTGRPAVATFGQLVAVYEET